MNFLMFQNMFLTQSLPSNTLSYDTKKIEEVRLFIFNQMQKTREVLVLYEHMCMNTYVHVCKMLIIKPGTAADTCIHVLFFTA